MFLKREELPWPENAGGRLNSVAPGVRWREGALSYEDALATCGEEKQGGAPGRAGGAEVRGECAGWRVSGALEILRQLLNGCAQGLDNQRFMGLIAQAALG